MAGAGIVLAVFLFLDALGVVGGHAVFNDELWRVVYKISSSLAPMLAIGIAAWCLKKAFSSPQYEGEKENHKVGYLILAGVLILGVAAVTFRSGILTEATGRAPEDHFPFFYVIVGLATGLILAWRSSGKARKVGWAFMGLVPVLIILSFYSGVSVDFQGITTERALRLGDAIDRYHLEHDAYPNDLGELTPGYMPIILGPLTGRGQVWCYQAGPDGYRLGYAFLQRYYDWGDGVTPFYEPYFAIKTPVIRGRAPEGPWMCDTELEHLKIHRGL